MKRASRRAALALALFTVGSLCAVASSLIAKPADVPDRAIETRVSVIPINFDRDRPERKEFGKLIFRGGLNLFGRSRHFGGFSGIAWIPPARRCWPPTPALDARDLTYDGRWLKGMENVTLGPILGHDGKPLRIDAERDAEGLALTAGDTRTGQALVSFEREHRILRYPFTMKSFGPPGGVVRLPKEAGGMDANQGLEAVALIHAGPLKDTVVALSERLQDANGNLRGWLIGGRNPGPITVRRLGGFDITDAAGLPEGGLILLERRFRYSEGVKMRIRRISAAELKAGRLIEGEVLLEATDRLNIDNMEAIAVHRSRAGETVLTLMSDDNFSPFQRSLIMQFALP
ncbi:hypothetical protein AUC71_11485 [Methyloceanibacter marginalis]|uniref:Phytase-like domain-containing protein n=1 Tax=Methyloceanibacter marginalis TaxID=1774971 RepID=A0A1E3WBB9_9HYPH|nr:esterase-like activity of phytase family protein [Methyloceanibacter marginalis]ODS03108.1 hypothetical protein AUC71_11485 [Methyloceanibacter marginalis]